MYIVRRSGRLSDRKIGNKDEVIDLTSPEWDEAGEEFINDEPNEHVHAAQETSEKYMNVYIAPNNAADTNSTLDENATVQVDKTENQKASRKAVKEKLVALAEKRKNKLAEKDGQGVVRKGKLAVIVEKTKKKQAEKGAGKRAAVKRKKEVLCDKRNKKQAVVENGNVRDNKVSDEVDESIDDDFVTNVGDRHGPGMDKENGIGRKKMDDDTTRSVKGLKGKGKSTDDDCGHGKRGKVPEVKNSANKINLRNPPGILFRVITHLTRSQKQDVRDIGFGAFLEYKIKDVPKRLAYWLLEKFDEDTCSLNVNGSSIMITPDVVRNMLGVPMGEVHINARKETDFRNPLAIQWKAQFGKALKRHYNTHVANEIVGKGRSGWMFKINFLVLFFSTVGELNLNNTVNLKFIQCINSEDDILKLDWCTYIVECLIKTKRSWKRNGFYNGPIILLLVLYANSVLPVKICSSDMLKKLEDDMFPKEDGGDTDVSEESELEASDEEQVLEKDDVEEDYYSVGVPTDLEGMKKYVSAILKKVGELVEMADEVLDQGLENNPTDPGFIELKELRNQLFTVPTYSQQPKNNPDEKEDDGPTNFSFHTPDEGDRQFLVTQMYGSPTGYGELQDKVWEEWHRNAEHIPTRLNFDEVDDIDLNVTQPPATQGKVVGGAEDENIMEEDESLLDAIVNYVSQERIEEDEFFTPDQTIWVTKKESKRSSFGSDSNEMVDSKAMVPAFSQPKPLNVLLGNLPYGRTKWRVVLPEVLRSPYVVREVSLICGISPHESRAADCLFSARLPETDIVFKMSHVDGPRSVLESLYPGVEIASGAIDLFPHVLNEAEKRKKYPHCE